MLRFFKHISLYCILFYSNAQSQNDVEQYKLNGKIKSIGIFSYNFLSGNNYGSFIKSNLVNLELFGKNQIVEFDKKGYKLKETHFSTRNHIRQGVYFYDKNNLKTSIAYGDFKKIFNYDTKQNISEEIWCYSKVCNTKYINKHFGNRLMIRKQKIRGSISEKIIYSYAEKHNKPTKEVVFHNGRNNNIEKQFTYNKKQQLTSIVKFNKGKIEENIRFKYDLKGRLSEKLSFYRIFSPNHHGSIYSYNNKNEIVKEVHYELDTRQKPLKEGGFVRNYEYKYDNKGNWILCNIYQDQIPKYTIERKISYYK